MRVESERTSVCQTNGRGPQFVVKTLSALDGRDNVDKVQVNPVYGMQAYGEPFSLSALF